MHVTTLHMKLDLSDCIQQKLNKIRILFSQEREGRFSKLTVMTCNSEKIKPGEENKPYMLIKRKEKCCKIDVEGRAQFPVRKLRLLSLTRYYQSN